LTCEVVPSDTFTKYFPEGNPTLAGPLWLGHKAYASEFEMVGAILSTILPLMSYRATDVVAEGKENLIVLQSLAAKISNRLALLLSRNEGRTVMGGG
jgi:hypothetical protein